MVSVINLAVAADQPSGQRPPAAPAQIQAPAPAPAKPGPSPAAADRTDSSVTAPGTTRPVSYRLPGSERRVFKYDAKAEIQGYAALVADSYATALDDGLHLKAAIDTLLINPNDDTLVRARDAWVAARRSWEQTEAFRFYDGPIDIADTETGTPGPIARLEGWPVDPAALDYVEDNPTAGIVNDMKLALTRRTLLDRQSGRGAARTVTTGWHVIEFLLWGQETSLGDAGDRPSTDYLPGQPNNDRRRSYLKLNADLLVEDLRYLVSSWAPKQKPSYAASFLVINQREALGRIMNGVARLAGEELAINRLAAALDSKDRQQLTSRFSGMSYQDLIFALRGVRNVWTGDHDGETDPGLEVLVGRVDAVLAQRIAHAINQAEASVAALETPLERETLPAPQDSPPRERAERAIADLKHVASLIRDAGVKLGVAVNLPS